MHRVLVNNEDVIEFEEAYILKNLIFFNVGTRTVKFYFIEKVKTIEFKD